MILREERPSRKPRASITLLAAVDWDSSEAELRIGKKKESANRARTAKWRIVMCACLGLAFSCGVANGQKGELAAISSMVQQGHLEEADKRLHRYLTRMPHSARAQRLLGEVYLHQGRFMEGEEALRKAIVDDPALLEARLDLGDAYLADGKLDLALDAYQRASKLSPHDTRVNLALAKLYLGMQKFAESIAAAGNIPAEKRTSELLPTLAADYFGLQQPERAEVEIRAMMEVAEKQPDLIPELAEFFLAHEDFKSADALLTVVKGKQPATDRLQIDVARTQAGLGQLDAAQTTLESVLEHAPDSVNALLAAGRVAGQQSDWAAAVEAFSRAGKVAPDRPEIIYGLVSAELHTNQVESALKDAQKLHTLVPDDLRATYLLALAQFGARKWEEAKSSAEKVLKTHPDDREMNLILVDIAFNNEQNLQVARKYVDICLKQNPADPGALYYLGMIKKMEGDINAAVESLTKSVAGYPNNADAQAALGSLCLQAGNLPKAIQALEQAVALAPDMAQNHYELAMAYSRSNASDKAKAQLGIYQQMKAKEAREAKESKGPSTSEVPPMGITSRP
jgi:tetratricopeptide (TPR) repeat protein